MIGRLLEADLGDIGVRRPRSGELKRHARSLKTRVRKGQYICIISNTVVLSLGPLDLSSS
jgi:hypothetical protein